MNFFYFLVLFLMIYPANIHTTSDTFKVEISSSDIEYIKAKRKEQRSIRGIHLTSWVAGNKERRGKIISEIKNSVINTVVIAVKEKNGEIYIPGIELAHKYKTYTAAISNPREVVDDFKKHGIYTVARIVCFHDDILPNKLHELAVKNRNGGIWKTKKGNTWVDPYKKEVWEYIADVAKKCVEYGFDEIQLDYVRYPTEGDTKNCLYSVTHNKENATRNISDFIRFIKSKVKNIPVSVDVFGLTTRSEMGIGQDLVKIAEVADRVCPMMYPSHYYKGEYNLNDPESNPYKVINRGLKEALKITGTNYYKIVPYLQDFSLRVKYTPYHIRAQIIAAKNNMIDDFILWNPSSNYSWQLLRPEIFCALIEPEKCTNL